MKIVVLTVVVLIVVAVLGLLLYGRSKLQPDGSLLLRSQAPLQAADERSFDRIISPDGLRAWWLGPLGAVETSAHWPRQGEKMTFQMGRNLVSYVVQSLDRPRRVVALAEYPDGRSEITQEFLGPADGGPAYRKTVVLRVNPGSGILKTWFLGAIVGISVPFEVKRAAAYADMK